MEVPTPVAQDDIRQGRPRPSPEPRYLSLLGPRPDPWEMTDDPIQGPGASPRGDRCVRVRARGPVPLV